MKKRFQHTLILPVLRETVRGTETYLKMIDFGASMKNEGLKCKYLETQTFQFCAGIKTKVLNVLRNSKL